MIKGIFIVGGFTRDILLEKIPNDVDYLVVGYTVGEFLSNHIGAIQIARKISWQR